MLHDKKWRRQSGPLKDVWPVGAQLGQFHFHSGGCGWRYPGSETTLKAPCGTPLHPSPCSHLCRRLALLLWWSVQSRPEPQPQVVGALQDGRPWRKHPSAADRTLANLRLLEPPRRGAARRRQTQKPVDSDRQVAERSARCHYQAAGPGLLPW